MDEKDEKERIKAAISLPDYIGQYTELKRSGKNRKGLCPLPGHDEKEPSFTVYPDGRFHCFGCGKNGDIFDFIQSLTGSTFRESLETASRYAGTDQPKKGPVRPVRKKSAKKETNTEKLFEALEKALTAYSGFLFSSEGKQAREYLQSRSVTDDAIRRFGIGACPPRNFLEKAVPGYEAEFLELGLVKENKRYDFFRNLVLFPIMDEKGRTVGFAGRKFPNASRSKYKYINSPGSVLYKKSELLFGLPLANGPVFGEKSCVVVEGYFDAIRLFQAGIENVVACGSAELSREQLEALKRVGAQKVVLFMDGDDAGRKGAEKSAKTAEGCGVESIIAQCPEGKKDPDEMTADEIEIALNNCRETKPKDKLDIKPSDLLRNEMNRKPGIPFPEHWLIDKKIVFARGLLSVIGGFSGVGKSRFLANLAFDAVKRGERTLFISLEMTGGQVAARIAQMAFVLWDDNDKQYCDIGDIFKKERNDDRTLKTYFERIDKLAKIIFLGPDNLNRDSDGLVNPTASGILELYESYSERFGEPETVIVDYLQLVRPEKGTESKDIRSQKIATVEKFAYGVLNTGAAWIFAAQMNRSSHQSGNRDHSGFQESAAIEQNAAMAGTISRGTVKKDGSEKEKENSLILNISKNRFGPLLFDHNLVIDPKSGAISDSLPAS